MLKNLFGLFGFQEKSKNRSESDSNIIPTCSIPLPKPFFAFIQQINFNLSPLNQLQKNISQKMTSYRNNAGHCFTTQNISNVENNAGKMETPNDSTISGIQNNAGLIKIGANSRIGEIINNCGKISVGPGSQIRRIKRNAGHIELHGAVEIGGVEDDCGKISRIPATAPPPPRPAQGQRNGQVPTPTQQQRSEEQNQDPPPQPTASSSSSSSSSPSSSNDSDTEAVDVDAGVNPVPAADVCKICLRNKGNLAFSCGHVSCAECGGRVDRCHICRAEITHRLPLFFT